MNFTKGSKQILNILKDSGYKAYIVGGAVRDALLGKPVNDIDITTSATPTQMLEVFKDYKVYETGLKHGTITVNCMGEFIEVTTFRVEDGYTDNRRPDSVKFVKDIKEDLKRRDFTINAMAYNDDEGLIDFFDGKKHLQEKVVKAVGDADQRFKEDSLRILRALRFASTLDFEIESQTKLACKNNCHLLKNVSAERIYAEFNKLLQGKGVGKVLIENKEVIFEIIPELKVCDGFDQKSKYHCYDVYTHIVKSVEFADRDRLVRWALLLHDVKKPECFTTDEKGTGHFYGHSEKSARSAVEILSRLKADNHTKKMVYSAVLMHDDDVPPNKKGVKTFLRNHGYELLKVLAKVKVGDALAHTLKYMHKRKDNALALLSISEEVIRNNECYQLKDLKINGEHLKSLGFKGKQIKIALDKLLTEVIEDKIENDKEKLYNRATLLKL